MLARSTTNSTPKHRAPLCAFACAFGTLWICLVPSTIGLAQLHHQVEEQARAAIPELDEAVLSEAVDLYRLGKAYFERLAATMNREDLREAVRREQVVESNDVGRAEVIYISNPATPNVELTAIRVVHNETEISLLFTYDDHSHRVSMDRWVAAQNLLNGRNVVVIQDPDTEHQRVVAHQRSTNALDLRYWRTYWRVVAEPMNNAEKAIAGLCTAVEIAAMCLVDGARFALAETGVTQDVSIEPYAVKLFFGITFGVLGAKTLRNWTRMEFRFEKPIHDLPGHARPESPDLRSQKSWAKFWRVMKSTAVSLPYGVAMTAVTAPEGIATFYDQDPWVFAGTWAYTLLNMITSNAVKDEALRLVDLRRSLGLNQGDFVLKNPLWPLTHEYRFPGAQALAEDQFMRAATGFLRYLDLLLIGTVTLAAEHFHSQWMPEVNATTLYIGSFLASRLGYMATISLPMVLNHIYARHLHRQAAKSLSLDPSNPILQRQLTQVRAQERGILEQNRMLTMNTYSVLERAADTMARTAYLWSGAWAHFPYDAVETSWMQLRARTRAHLDRVLIRYEATLLRKQASTPEKGQGRGCGDAFDSQSQ